MRPPIIQVEICFIINSLTTLGGVDSNRRIGGGGGGRSASCNFDKLFTIFHLNNTIKLSNIILQKKRSKHYGIVC